MRILQRIWGLGLAFLTASLSGCGGGQSAEPVIVDGSSTVFRISKAAQQGYNQVAPDFEVDVLNHGTGGGFSRYLEGEVDIIDASRAARPEEESQARAKGLLWNRFTVGYD